MRVFGLLLGLLSLPILASTTLTTQIYDVDYGLKSGDETLILLTSGHVAKVKPGHHHLLDQVMLEKSEKSGQKRWFQVTMDENRYITKLEKKIPPLSSPVVDFESMRSLNDAYVPTTIESMDVAKKYFREARYNPKESQCFNRAMVWTYEWWKKHSLKSNKLLIFFTRNYIRRYDFDWWFHITPMVHIMDNGTVVERTMDRKYSSGPLAFKKWTDIFMRNDAECPIITKFSDYADYPYTGECFLYRTTMYTYQPADLQMYEAWGYHKEAFNLDEVKGAYKEAFDENVDF